ncbi:MAG: hypothetical protein ACKPKO_22525 [Candidatus Fonsibacter sp.]
MPYKNAYNKDIVQQVRFLAQNHVNREKEINDFATNYENMCLINTFSYVGFTYVGPKGHSSALEFLAMLDTLRLMVV